jgi:hypothetical protein
MEYVNVVEIHYLQLVIVLVIGGEHVDVGLYIMVEYLVLEAVLFVKNILHCMQE